MARGFRLGEEEEDLILIPVAVGSPVELGEEVTGRPLERGERERELSR